MDLYEIIWDCIDLTQDRDKWWAVWNMVMNLRAL
jgi:hypothetical protein